MHNSNRNSSNVDQNRDANPTRDLASFCWMLAYFWIASDSSVEALEDPKLVFKHSPPIPRAYSLHGRSRRRISGIVKQ
jgi:hypothetical protein